MANEYSKWATEFAEKNGRQPTFDEYLAYKKAQSPEPSDDFRQPAAPAQWVKDFVVKNDRQPTFAEYRAHQSGGAEDSPKNAPMPTRDDSPPGQEPAAENNEGPSNDEDTAASPKQSSVTAPKPATEKTAQTAKHRGWRAPLFIALLLMFVTAGSVVSYGWFTQRDKAKLERQYTAAVRDKDAVALLQLFPSEQTQSLFAKDGAKQIIAAKIPFKQIAAKKAKGLTVQSRPYWLFFKNYYLSTQLTALTIPKPYKDGKIAYRKKPLKEKQISDNPLFWGKYAFVVTPKATKNETAPEPVTVTLMGGEKKTVALSGSGTTATAQSVDPNKWQNGVPKDLQRIYFRKVSNGSLDIDNFTLTAAGNDHAFYITGGPGDGTQLERIAYRTLAKNLYIVRGQTPLDAYQGTFYVKVRYENGAHGQRLAVYKSDGFAKGVDELAEAEKSTEMDWFDAQTIVAPKGRTLKIGSGSFLKLNADFTYVEEAVQDKPWAAMVGGGRWYLEGNEIRGYRQHMVVAFFSTEDFLQADRPFTDPIQKSSDDRLTGQDAYAFVISKRSDGTFEYRLDDWTGRVYPITYGEHEFSDEQKTYEKWLNNSMAHVSGN
ncbi:hypothetical protein [Schleiferilactobacillus harbinensis]|uniref:hypothetical protein n=1 Tax=Schleiferilactobacillus harbinensis TaxID=304207 RepID=UPI00345E1803